MLDPSPLERERYLPRWWFLTALACLLVTAPQARSHQTEADPARAGEPSAEAPVDQEAPDSEDAEGGQEDAPPPPPPPPDGLLPVTELARFEHSPRDRPHVRFLGDYLIVTSRSGTVQGIDALTGELQWKLGLPGEDLFPSVVLPRPLDPSLLLSTPTGHLFVLDVRTGEIESEKRLSFPLALAPLVSGGSVLYAGTPEGVIHGYDLESERELFATPIGEVPAALEGSAGLVVVSGGVRTLTALDSRTGSVKWTRVGRGPFRAPVTFGAGEKRLYVGNDTGEFYCLDADNGNVEFSWSTGAAIRSPALVEGDRVYVASYGNTVYAYGAGNGHEQWRAHLPGRPASGPVRLYERFMVATLDGTLMEIVPARGQLGKSHVLPGELLSAPAFHIVPPPAISSPAAEPPLEDESPEEPAEPKWYELSRIAVSLRSGQVLLLRHQPPAPPEPEETPESVEGETGGLEDEDVTPIAAPPVPF